MHAGKIRIQLFKPKKKEGTMNYEEQINTLWGF